MAWFKDKEAKAAVPTPSSPSAKSLTVGKLLTEELIVLAPPGLGKDQLLDLLVRRLCTARSLGDPAPFLSRVLEREQGISTTLDTGLAVPHARMDGLASIAAVLGLVPQGMPDPKQPDLVIRAMFLFFSPNRQDAFTQHLHLLRGVSALFQPAFIEEALAKPTPADVLALVRAKEAS